MNKLVAIAGVIVVTTAVTLNYKNNLLPSPNSNAATDIQADDVHLHAGFQVYINNELQDYTGVTHMKIEPCYEGERHELTLEEEQLEKAHLHDNVGDVAHIHRAGATWGDLFINANIPLADDAVAYINGKEIADFRNKVIEANESIVILQGENTDIDLKLASAVSQEHIAEVEGMSENCSS